MFRYLYFCSVELDESVCIAVQDQDLEGAFHEDVDPWNLAYIKYNPSAKNSHSEFADESYQPPKDLLLNNLPKMDVVTGEQHLAKSDSPEIIRFQDKFRQPFIEISANGMAVAHKYCYSEIK